VIHTIAEKTAIFDAVVATGKTTGWAFQGSYYAKPVAYERTGATWKKVSFPGVANEEVVATGATSATDVWAFANLPSGKSQAVRLVSGKWTVAKTFDAPVASASVLAGNDVWIAGYPGSGYLGGHSALGLYHFDGSNWSLVAGGLASVSALSASDAWAANGTTVVHLKGGKEKAYNLASLLPARLKNHLNYPTVDDVLALSDDNVYAIGSGHTQDDGGPIVILHYNGYTWTKVAGYAYGNPETVSYDGTGGLWIPAGGAGFAFLLHYSGGKLIRASLPASVGRDFFLLAISRVPGSAEQLAVGNTSTPASTGSDGIILQYS
jgi:hypothetical protein